MDGLLSARLVEISQLVWAPKSCLTTQLWPKVSVFVYSNVKI